jgi:NAD(P) transhydrogenase subunit beta
MTEHLIQIFYLVSSVMFILGLRIKPSRYRPARHVPGRNRMALAIIGTLLDHEVIRYDWIIAGMIVGSWPGRDFNLDTDDPYAPTDRTVSRLRSAGATLVGVAGSTYGQNSARAKPPQSVLK